MDAVSVVSCAVWRCVDACCLLLEPLLRMLSWLLHFLSHTGCSLHSLLLALNGSSLVEYWNLALFCFLTATEFVSGAAHGALRTLESWLQALGGVFESFKMVGHLSCHVAWRAKELLHRGLVSGNSVLRQTCEGLCIALSLVLYFVNTVVNIVLIGMQNCFSALAGAWEAVAGPLHKAVELALTLLTFLYSCLVGASVLLWTPCQLLLDFLGALARVFVTVFVVDGQGLFVTALIVSLALLYLNPELPLLVGRLSLRLLDALPGARAAARRPRAPLPERAPADRDVRAGRPRDADGTGPPNTDLRAAGSAVDPPLLPNEASRPDSPQLRAHPEGEPPSGGGDGDGGPSAAGTDARPSPAAAEGGEDDGGPPADSELLSLLKEQEERKKCVICQDSAKTVLLLPCRHLCLCRLCADILTQRRPVQQRCCPLCRQHITQNMDVFL
ncbi:E3 ubiquitin-protein ligase RNF26-like [Centroberyx affinis]|uniref:E3 ubiquitin-protein ligase RNF26-like n=1 Tax=Centroberyx affinis TaxID=166261 RepID=UPI003A5BD5CC